MCGIFGFSGHTNSLERADAQQLLNRFFHYSEKRGKEACGLSIRSTHNRVASIYKTNQTASQTIKTDGYKKFLAHHFDPIFLHGEGALVALGHARMVTNGMDEDNNNNQPVLKSNASVIHNGIVTNIDALWAAADGRITRSYVVDTEIINALFDLHLAQSGDVSEALAKMYESIEGSASIAIDHNAVEGVVLATNCGSLYLLESPDSGLLAFASERYTLEMLAKESNVAAVSSRATIRRLEPGQYAYLDPHSSEFQIASFLKKSDSPRGAIKYSYQPIKEFVDRSPIIKPSPKVPTTTPLADLEKLLEYDVDLLSSLRRCSKCVLPESFPFIKFNSSGVCNYCEAHEHRPKAKGRESFETLLARFRRDAEQDCVFAFSGGRDSSYGLHLIRNEFGMNPITFTYDWGLVTDLARRNISKMCGELGVENILVSADIRKKRDFVRRNIEAWQKKPDLGIVPLFMAGDKYFFYHVNQIKRETGIELDLWSTNRYENTEFKVGFCGIPPKWDKEKIDELSIKQKIQLPMYYMKQFMGNPGYFNRSIVDTLGAYWSYYFESRNNLAMIFDYVDWVEEEVESCLIDQYGWEVSPETDSTWRIGDGTAAFYNYVYCTTSGFSEFDTFRSNQVRDGAITREKALERVLRENKPMFQSILWYCNTLNLDFEALIKSINSMAKRHLSQLHHAS